SLSRRARSHRAARSPPPLRACGWVARVVADVAEPPRARLGPRLTLALALSLGLLALRLHTARGLGYGDAEALYACYALYPQPAYLDHPGLIGVLMSWVGRGSAPEAPTAHGVSALIATLVP